MIIMIGIALIFLLGWMITYLKIIPSGAYKTFNKLIIYVIIPCLTISKVSQLTITKDIIFPAFSAWIIFFGAGITFTLLSKPLHLKKKTIGCLILCCGLGNTSFIGYPFIEHFYGNDSIVYAIFVDQPGSFLILSTFGIITAYYFSAQQINLNSILKKILLFPPFIVFIIALFIPNNWVPTSLLNIFENIGKLVTPLALLSIGMQFNLNFLGIEWKNFWIGILYKLAIAPLLIYIIYNVILQKNGIPYTISVIECAMPPMITASILASEFELDEQLASLLPTLGILLSLPSLLIWNWLLT